MSGRVSRCGAAQGTTLYLRPKGRHAADGAIELTGHVCVQLAQGERAGVQPLPNTNGSGSQPINGDRVIRPSRDTGP